MAIWESINLIKSRFMNALRCYIVDKEPAFHRITNQVILYDNLPIQAEYFLSPVQLIDRLDALDQDTFPDFIFADFHGYVYNGKELASLLRKRYSWIKKTTHYVLTITSRFEKDYIRLTDEDPVDMVVIKPFSKHLFLSVVDTCIPGQ